MQSLDLLFHQRVLLWDLLGNYHVQTLKEASVFLRILEKLRITDQEQTET
jgi:hypothetical protein